MITSLSQLTQGLPGISHFCICCRQRLVDRDGYCPHCQTPVALSQTAADGAAPPTFFSVLGASNAGKTVYLGLLLDILSKGTGAFRGTTVGTFSVELQEQVVTALERRRFPQKTPSEADSWKWLHCQITRLQDPPALQDRPGRGHIDLIAPDFAGEAIALEVTQAGLYPAIQHVVGNSAGLMILCDSLQVRDAGSAEDLFALKLATYVAQIHGLIRGRCSDAPAVGPALAIVFTKCDGCPEAVENPAAFAAHNAPRLHAFCKRTFKSHAYFAVSVVGSSIPLEDGQGQRVGVPLHLEPQGILEPLQWLIQHNPVTKSPHHENR